MSKKVKNSRLLNEIHESVSGLYDAGILDAKTMRKFDSLCLPEVKPLTPLQIKQLRLKNKASQSVFARYLNLSTSTIYQWEKGEKYPQGASLKLLNLVASKGLDILI